MLLEVSSRRDLIESGFASKKGEEIQDWRHLALDLSFLYNVGTCFNFQMLSSVK